MAELPNKIRITVGSVQLDAELKSTKTAQEVYAALPVESAVNTWGEEFYCKLAGVKDYRETATNTGQSRRCRVLGGRAGSGYFLRPDTDEHGARSGSSRPCQCHRPYSWGCRDTAASDGCIDHPNRDGYSRMLKQSASVVLASKASST